jgi:hypothetical protein
VTVMLRPTRLVRLALLALGALVGAALWKWATFDLVTYLSGAVAPFCMLCAGAVWALRDKAEDRLVPTSGDSAEVARAFRVVNELRRQFAPLAVRTAVLALVAAGPAMSAQLAKVIWEWSVYAAVIAAAEASFAYLLASAWDERLRAEREKRTVDGLREAERIQLLQRLYPSQGPEGEIGDWRPSQQPLVGAESRH